MLEHNITYHRDRFLHFYCAQQDLHSLTHSCPPQRTSDLLHRIVRLLPAKRQGLLFSATFSNEIRKPGRSFLNNPIEIEVAARNATAENVSQIAYPVPSGDKRAAVVHLVKSRGFSQVIVFSNTQIGTGRLARQLEPEERKSGR